MAKIDAHAVTFSKRAVTVSELIGDVMPAVSILLDINSQTLQIINDLKIDCDKKWTVEALTNIIKNAIEHLPNDSEIVIDSGENPMYQWISVQDSGAGMNRSSYAALFKRFEYSTNENGFGIGMPLALSIIKGQGGDIDIDFGGKGQGESEVVALDHVSFSVEKGEFVAIIGAYGSGKSTLMNMIGGIDNPTGGSVIIDGKDISHMNEDELAIFRRRNLGMIYQFYNLIPTLTAEENIVLPWKLDGRKENKARVDEILKMLGLEKRADHLPGQMSGGQQQRVSIGRALINEPAFILADEPTGNLDSKTSREIIDILKLTNQKYSQTILLVTHDDKIALQADRVITICDGKILKDEVMKS